MNVVVDTDPARLDVARVHRWLSEDTYWARGRSRALVERAIAGSLSFGAYRSDEQVGYARLVTDHATFAWLCDVYVDPTARGTGVARALLDAVDATLRDLQVKRAVLSTSDAHGLYASYGFEVLAQPGKWMMRGYGTP